MINRIRLSQKILANHSAYKKFSFETDSALNKKDFVEFIEKNYHTKVKSVSVLVRKGKNKKFKGHSFFRKDKKIFYFSLEKDASDSLLIEEMNRLWSSRYSDQNASLV